MQTQYGKQILIVSADNHMTKNGKYVFDASKLTASHIKCQGEARNALHSSDKTVVFIANKNSNKQHIEMYAAWGYPFLSVVFTPSSVEHAVALGEGNPKHIPDFVFERCFEEVQTLKLTEHVFPKLKGVCKVSV